MPKAGSPEVRRLDPESLFASYRWRHVSHGSSLFCGVPTEGLGSSHGLPPANVIWAGFDYWRSDGWYCWESMDYVFRGGVQFDLGGFQKYYGGGNYMLLSAVLEFWRQEPHDECDAGSTLIFTSNGDWPHGTLDNYLIPTTAKDEDFVDSIPPFAPPPGGGLTGLQRINATSQVLSWASGDRPNFGFCFMGTDESMPDDRNSVCVNQFAMFKLEINYLPFDGWEPEDIFPPEHKRISPRRPQILPTFTTTSGKLPESVQNRLGERRQTPPPANQRSPETRLEDDR